MTPKSSRDAIGGEETISDSSVAVLARVRGLPENGAANAALESLMPKVAGVARTRVAVVSGATSRLKTVEIESEPAATVGSLNEVLKP